MHRWLSGEARRASLLWRRAVLGAVVAAGFLAPVGVQAAPAACASNTGWSSPATTDPATRQPASRHRRRPPSRDVRPPRTSGFPEHGLLATV